ncbi:hypothetical protein [Propionicimonas paludicola]|uniref:hypothetical protein n=1 Tax=Propionicimonas paludicola TaxID=185243 RepID=UPI000BF84A04|nr:hypothetical protein [Propionicimonas paludicola]
MTSSRVRHVTLRGASGSWVIGRTLGAVTADRQELHELVDALPDDQVARVLADVRRRLPAASGERPWPRRSSAWVSTRTAVRTCL